ncbi:MAG: hypothetical protein SVY53_07735 [Chloroflexota bacterium]|nr:hypothetical protein [Chloroflexota bacterium]
MRMFKTIWMINVLLIGTILVLGIGYVVGSEVNSIWSGASFGSHTKDVVSHLGDVVPVWFSDAFSGMSDVMESSVALSVGIIAGIAVFFIVGSWSLVKGA